MIDSLKWRYAVKRYDITRKITDADLQTILEAIRLAPTSLGLQAFKVLVINNSSVKESLFTACYQQPSIIEASHLLVFCIPSDKNIQPIITSYLHNIANTRQHPLSDLNDFKLSIENLIADDRVHGVKEWLAKQTYLLMGFALAQAAELKIDSTPIEGFIQTEVNKILHLEANDLNSILIMALGYRDEENDFLATSKKVRRLPNELFKFI